MDIPSLLIQRLQPEVRTGKRCAPRYPIRLPVQVLADEKEYEATTDNISANGVLLRMKELLAPGTIVEFLIHIPEGAIAPNETAAVHCTGRVVRSYRRPKMTYAAAVIEEYSFQ